MKRPFIFCHMETSLDGKIMGKYLWRPSAQDEGDTFDLVQREKYSYEALILGRTTIDDNYTLYEKPEIDENALLVEEGDFIAEGAESGQYLIAVDGKGRLAWQDSVMEEGGKKAHIVEILTEKAGNGYKDFLRKKGISYLICGKDRVDLPLACEKIKDILHVNKMMLGGGAVLNWSFLQAGLVDEVSQVIAPAADGSRETQTLFMTAEGITKDQPVLFKPVSVEIMEDDAVWIRWRVEGKVDFDLDSDPAFMEVTEMIRSHRE